MAAKFDIAPALQAAIRLGRTAAQVKQLKQRATGTLRRRMPVESRRDIQQEYNLTASRINKGLSTAAIEGGVQITGSARGIGLIQFSARQTAKGVTYAIRKGQRQLEQGAFIQTPAKSPASGKQVFEGWPTDDPRSAIIWEAFKPDTEPDRYTRQDEIAAKRNEILALIRAGRQNAGDAVTDEDPDQPADFVEEQGGIY